MENDVQSAEQHDSAKGSRGEISRRGVGRAAAWAVPVVVFAAAAPAYAASPPCNIRSRSAYYTYWTFASLNSDDEWRSSSTLTAIFQPGSPASDGNRGGLSYGASRTGVTVATASYSMAITYPARFTWSVPTDWVVTEVVVAPGSRWKYTFTKTSATNAVSALTPIDALPTNPDSSIQNAIPRGPIFRGTAVQVTWANGTQVSNGPSYTFPIEVRGSASASATTAPRCRGPYSLDFNTTVTISPRD